MRGTTRATLAMAGPDADGARSHKRTKGLLVADDVNSVAHQVCI